MRYEMYKIVIYVENLVKKSKGAYFERKTVQKRASTHF